MSTKENIQNDFFYNFCIFLLKISNIIAYIFIIYKLKKFIFII